jgi:type VI secretion system secreted protein VgrG
MAVRRLGLEADFFFEAGPYTDKDLKLIRFEGSEGISELFHFQLQLALDDLEADFDAVLGKPGLLRIEGREGTRYISGIVSRFEQSSERTQLTQYSAEMVPRIWLLGQRRTSRIFQGMTVPDIIKKVLSDTKIAPDQYKLGLQRSYVQREYCVQYRESDLAFISRLMEEEGIYYWFEHSEGKHVLVMGDSSSGHQQIPGDQKLQFQEVTGEEPEFEHIYHFRYAEQVRSGEVVLRDFDFKKPTLDLTARRASDRFTELQVYDYPGEYTQPSVGSAWSEVRLQELQAIRKVGAGKTNCRRMVPGYKFTMEQHPRANFNREYLLTKVLHKGAQIQALKEAAGTAQANEYSCEYLAIPSDVQYRPARRTERPVVHGSQTAIVTGPAGEEIYPDEHGRVKVHFHWDREGKADEKSSCWIRVSQNWAGSGWGAMIIPRIGQEVIVDFLEGDPDQPIITGRVYNGDNRAPYPLPDMKTRSTLKSNSSKGGGGSNEMRFEDAKGAEEIYLHGQKDWDIVIENDKTQKVGHDESHEVGHDRSKHVRHDQSEEVDNNKSIRVGVNHSESVGANMSINVGSNLSENVGINYAENVGAAMELTVGALMTQIVGAALVQTVGASKSVEVGANLNQSVGSSASESVGADKSAQVGGDRTISVGKDDSLSVGKNLTVAAGDQISFKTGEACITLKKDGTITLEGKDINIKASGGITAKGSKNIVLKGQKVLQN